MLRKFLRISGIFLLIGIAIFVGISIQHSIVLKWVIGSARIVGLPKKASIYTNGKANSNVNLYKVERYFNGQPANGYLLHFKEQTASATKTIIGVNLTDKYVGKPSVNSKKDYDIIAGLLFQSETGAKFTPFTNDIKGFGFDPDLQFSDRKITFALPADKYFDIDSVRIEL